MYIYIYMCEFRQPSTFTCTNDRHEFLALKRYHVFDGSETSNISLLFFLARHISSTQNIFMSYHVYPCLYFQASTLFLFWASALQFYSICSIHSPNLQFRFSDLVSMSWFRSRFFLLSLWTCVQFHLCSRILVSAAFCPRSQRCK